MVLTKRVFLVFTFVLFFLTGKSQYNDFGVWNKLTLKKDLPKGFDLGLDGQLRWNENSTELATAFFDLSLKYKINDVMSVVGNYRFGNTRELDDYYDLRQRFALDLNFRYDWNEFGFKWRTRYQTGSSNIQNIEDRVDVRSAWRNKLSVDRKVIKKTTAWTSFEWFTGFSEGYIIPSDWRWKIGVDRKIRKRQVLSVGFMVQEELWAVDPVKDFVVLVGYEIELKKKKKKKKKKGTPTAPKPEL